MPDEIDTQTLRRLEMLETDVSELKTDVARIGPQLSTMLSKLDNLEDKESRPINVIGVAGLVLTVIGAIIWFNQQLNLHIQEPGHLLTEVNSANIEKLDNVLQREMRILDELTSQEIEALDVVLQREIALNRQVLESKIDQLNQRHDALRNAFQRANIPEAD